MTTTVTTASVGPLVANGVTALPFTFQAISASEIEVTRNGTTAATNTYTVALNADGTGSVTPTSTWGSDTVYIYSSPTYQQGTNFQRFGAWYPDQINAPLDRLARGIIALKSYLLRTVTTMIAAIPPTPGPPGINGAAGSGSGFAALFSAANGMTIAAGDKRIKMDGYSLPGIGGADYIYDVAVTSGTVAANPRTQFLAADGRGFKLDPTQRLTIEMFGAVAGGSNALNGTNNLAAILAAIAFAPIAGLNFTPTIYWPLGNFYVSATINVHKVVHWIGSGNGANGSSVAGFTGTRIITPVDVTTIINHNSNTTEAGSQAPNGAMSAGGSIYFGIAFGQQTKGTSATAYGFWMRGTAQLIQCSAYITASHGIYMYCTATSGGLLEGDCNNWLVDHCFAHTIGGNALHIQGQDVNAGLSNHFVTAGNTIDGCGIFDRAGLGNTHVMPQMTGYGNGGVFNLGSLYQLVDDSAGLGGSTTPGTNRSVWYPIRTAGAPLATFPQWVAATAYTLKLPMFIIGPSTVVGGYQEFGSVLAHCPGAALFGAPFAFTTSTNSLKPWGVGTGLGAIAGIGAYRGSGGTTTTPEYVDEGAYSLTMLGTKDLQNGDITKRPNILEHRTAQDGEVSMAWHWDTKNQVLRYLNQKPIWSFGGPGTTRQHGRGVAQPYYFTMHDFVLQDPTNSTNLRTFGLRDAVPASGLTARGDHLFQMNATAAGKGAWVTTTSGTYGSTAVVKPWGVIDA